MTTVKRDAEAQEPEYDEAVDVSYDEEADPDSEIGADPDYGDDIRDPDAEEGSQEWRLRSQK